MRYDKGYILKVLCSQANEWKKEPRWGLPRGEFERRSYYNSGMEQLIREIKLNNTPPITTTKIFIYKMGVYAGKNRRNRDMFLSAKQAGEDVLDILETMKGDSE